MTNSSTHLLAALRRRPLLLVVLVALAAFWGSLRATYYMDDYMFVVNSRGDAPIERHSSIPFLGNVGAPQSPTALQIPVFELLPTSFWVLTDHLVKDPITGSWLYHFWNLLVHTATACAVFKASREVLAVLGLGSDDLGRSRLALTGTLLFACHPLCSEPVNYVKCLNHLLAALFAVVSVWQGAKWLRLRTQLSGILCLTALLLTSISYFPGLFIAGSWLLLLSFAAVRSGTGPKITRRFVVALTALAAWGLYVYVPFIIKQFESWHERQADHIFTQSRIFWNYVQLTILPSGLCSDHQVTWSTSWQDPATLVAMGGILLLVSLCFAAIVFRKFQSWRGYAVLVLMGISPLLVRFLYVNSEPMVEYRTYPALPWLMLLAGTGISALSRVRPAIPHIITFGAVTCFLLMSGLRTMDWSNQERLLNTVIEKYPLSHRARTQLQAHYDETGRQDKIPAIHRDIITAIHGMEAYNATHASRHFDLRETSISLVQSAQWMVYAMATEVGSKEALEWADYVIPLLQREYPMHFVGDLSLNTRDSLPNAWPLLTARKVVQEHALEIDATRKARLDSQN